MTGRMWYRKSLMTFVSLFSWSLLLTLSESAELPGPRSAWTSSKISGAPTPPAPYRVRLAFPKLHFENPTCLEEIPGRPGFLVTELAGKVFTFHKTSKVKAAVFAGNLAEIAGDEVTLFDAEFHPDFLNNRYIYFCYVHPGTGGHTRVSRFVLSRTRPPTIDTESETVIIRWPSGGHNAGCLEFGKDGYLYISTGDGAGPNPPDGLTTGQDVSDLLGAVLRIDVNQNGAGKNYVVPADNPFLELENARPEIWAYGLRNPWKFGIDAETNDVFVADNGWETWEMVHKLQAGGNCGWPVMEARAALRTEVPVGPTPIIPPVKDHHHSEANSVIGGPVYRGTRHPDLTGAFIYGDYITGTIWSVTPMPDNTYNNATLVDTDLRIAAFTETSAGEVFVVDYDYTGAIYELLPSDRPDTSLDFPRRLSQTGLFSSTEELQPADGVVPYEVQVPRWMDGANARRWIAIPGNAEVQLSSNAEERTVYPNGTVFVKQLDLPLGGDLSPLRLETQILHYENGTWNPYSYLWNETGDDAILVDASGTQRALQIPQANQESQERTWHVSAVNECRLCHNAGSDFVLGFTAPQLNHPRSAESTTFLTQLANQKVLNGKLEIAERDPLELVNPHDDSQSIEDRARSYLHANCSMCHHKGGNAIVSFFLRRDLTLEETNTDKGTGIGTFGMENAKIILPGDPFRSVLIYRMAKLGYARMPYIGSRVVDSAGVALISKWIHSLPASDTATASPPLQNDSEAARALQSLVNADNVDRTTRNTAINTLVQSTEGSLALLTQMHAGTLSDEDMDTAITAGSDTPNRNIRGLFDTFIPEASRRLTLGSKIDPESILSLQGNEARGKLIFFSDGARCRACHDIDRPQQSLGPTLKAINKKYVRDSEMLQHVLQPSLKIDDKVAAYTAFTSEGRSITGLLLEKNNDKVVLKTADRKILSIAREDTEELIKSTKSLMPDQLLSDLTAQEAADLFSYIRSLGSEATSSE